MHQFGFRPADLQAQFAWFAIVNWKSSGEFLNIIAIGQQDGVVSVFEISKMEVAERHGRDLCANPWHEVVNNAVEKVWSSYTSLSDATVDVKPLREFPVYADAALGVSVELLEQP